MFLDVLDHLPFLVIIAAVVLFGLGMANKCSSSTRSRK